MADERIAVIGLGYVGLPLALALARRHPHVVGFDIDSSRILSLRAGEDRTREVEEADLVNTSLRFTDLPDDLRDATFFVVTVPTPVDEQHRPDLRALLKACGTIGQVIRPGAAVVFESTVFPGATEEICGPEIARVSGLRQGVDFTLGYSPERINPGDREHRIDRIVKVVAAEDAATLERVAAVYGPVIEAGLHRAPSIKVAEAAKVIENTQRDLNIALMNECALIFGRLGLRTQDVLAAAQTKWNFLRFSPGLVGGHCIGVDPYYLTAKAEAVGYHPQVILAGRRINDQMGSHVARELIKLLAQADQPVKAARVAVLGISFKENVPDLRNSRSPDIVRELRQFGIEPLVHDPLADPEEAEREYGIRLCRPEEIHDMDALVLAVAHEAYRSAGPAILAAVRPGGILMDIKSIVDPAEAAGKVRYWSL